MQRFRVDLKTFLAWLCLTNTPKLSESKYQADFGEIILGQNPNLHDPSIYSITVLYDNSIDLILHTCLTVNVIYKIYVIKLYFSLWGLIC